MCLFFVFLFLWGYTFFLKSEHPFYIQILFKILFLLSFDLHLKIYILLCFPNFHLFNYSFIYSFFLYKKIIFRPFLKIFSRSLPVVSLIFFHRRMSLTLSSVLSIYLSIYLFTFFTFYHHFSFVGFTQLSVWLRKHCVFPCVIIIYPFSTEGPVMKIGSVAVLLG